MPNLTISIGALTKSKNLSAEQVGRFLAAYRDLYKSDDPNAPIPTDSELFNMFANGIFKGIINNVLNYEENDRIKIAREIVLPFE